MARALGEQRGERAALHELHREIGPLVREQAELVDGHDAGMLELAADLRLLDEAFQQLRFFRELLAQNLHRDVAAEVAVAALQDDSHAAARDLAEELVAAATLWQSARFGRLRVDLRRRAAIVRRIAQQD